MKPFDPELDTELLVGPSKVAGAGYILIQRSQEGSVHIVRCGSGAASMAPIRTEAAVIGWAVEYCAHFLKRSDKTISVITDRYPLVAVIGKCVLDLSQRL